MTVIDYVFLIALAVGLVLGLIKGFIKQILAIVGVFIIALGTAWLTPFVTGWLTFIEEGGTRSFVAMLATFVLLALLYGLISKLISKLINKTPGVGALNRVLGAVFSIAVVYLIFAVLVALLIGTSASFLAGIKEAVAPHVEGSWVVNTLYGGTENPERNFFGNWLLQIAVDKLSDIIPAPEEGETAMALLALVAR